MGRKAAFSVGHPWSLWCLHSAPPFQQTLKCVCLLIGKWALSERRAWVGMQLASLYVCFRDRLHFQVAVCVWHPSTQQVAIVFQKSLLILQGLSAEWEGRLVFLQLSFIKRN